MDKPELDGVPSVAGPHNVDALNHGMGMTQAAKATLDDVFGEAAGPTIAFGMAGMIVANVNLADVPKEHKKRFKTAKQVLQEMFVECAEGHYAHAKAESEKLVVLAPTGPGVN